MTRGGCGAHIGVTARGQLPGTGVSWRQYRKPVARGSRGGDRSPHQSDRGYNIPWLSIRNVRRTMDH